MLSEICDRIVSSQKDIEIVSGGARGADQLGELYAKSKGFALKRFPANWDVHGISAGIKRNIEMAEYADALIAFWNNKSSGTRNMINEAKKRDLKIRVIIF